MIRTITFTIDDGGNSEDGYTIDREIRSAVRISLDGLGAQAISTALGHIDHLKLWGSKIQMLPTTFITTTTSKDGTE